MSREKKYQFVDRASSEVDRERATHEYRTKVLEALDLIKNELTKQTELIKELKSVQGE